MMTRSARKFVGEVTFEAITRRRVITDQYAPRRERGHRAHRARLEHRAPARRPGDGQHHRQVRQRHRRRFPQLALPRHAGAGADGAGHEHQHARARGRSQQHGDARGARRAIRRSRRRLSGLRLDRQGPPRRARGHRGRGRRAAAAEGHAARPLSSSSPPGRLTRISTTSGISAIDRAGRWGMRWPPRPRGAARGSCSSRGRHDSIRRQASRWCGSAVRPRCTTRCRPSPAMPT